MYSLYMNKTLFLNIEDEHNISYKKTGRKTYSFYVSGIRIVITVRKIDRITYHIYQGLDIIATIKKPMFGTKRLYYKDNLMNCLLIKDKNNVYIPPLCINNDGFNSFISDDINKVSNYDLMIIKNKQIIHKNSPIFCKYNISETDAVKEHCFIFNKPLTIIHAISLSLLLK